MFGLISDIFGLISDHNHWSDIRQARSFSLLMVSEKDKFMMFMISAKFIS